MEAPSNGTPGIQIALRPNEVGERSLKPGDRFRTDHYISRGDLTERAAELLVRHGFVGPLTRQSYQRAMARREPGEIGRGFTEQELIAAGIIDSPAPGEPRAAPKKAQPKKALPAPDGPKPLLREEYKGHVIQQVVQGRFRPYEALTTAGELLRPERFRKLDKARQFIDGLGAADPAAKSAEAGDGHDVQPDPERRDLESSL